jgi:hypothetical protein
VLPLTNHIFGDTLKLINYQLSQGHVDGLQISIPSLNCKRFIFTANNLTGLQFSQILKGISQVTDCKSITYGHNAFTNDALLQLVPLLDKKIPCHLEELIL